MVYSLEIGSHDGIFRKSGFEFRLIDRLTLLTFPWFFSVPPGSGITLIQTTNASFNILPNLSVNKMWSLTVRSYTNYAVETALLIKPRNNFPLDFPIKSLYAFVTFSIRATCPAHLIFHDLMVLIQFGEEYKACPPFCCCVVFNKSKYSPQPLFSHKHIFRSLISRGTCKCSITVNSMKWHSLQ